MAEVEGETLEKTAASRAKLVFFLTFGPIALLFAVFLVALTISDSSGRSSILIIEFPYVAAIVGLIIRAIYGLNLEATNDTLVYRTMFRTIQIRKRDISKIEMGEASSGFATIDVPELHLSGGKVVRLRIFGVPKTKSPSEVTVERLRKLDLLTKGMNEWAFPDARLDQHSN